MDVMDQPPENRMQKQSPMVGLIPQAQVPFARGKGIEWKRLSKRAGHISFVIEASASRLPRCPSDIPPSLEPTIQNDPDILGPESTRMQSSNVYFRSVRIRGSRRQG